MIRKRSVLSSDNLEVAGHSTFVLGIREIERALRSLHGRGLNPGFLFEHPQGGEVVLNLLKSGQNGLAVRCDRRVVGVFGFIRAARLRPPSKTVTAAAAPMDQIALGP